MNKFKIKSILYYGFGVFAGIYLLIFLYTYFIVAPDIDNLKKELSNSTTYYSFKIDKLQIKIESLVRQNKYSKSNLKSISERLENIKDSIELIATQIASSKYSERELLTVIKDLAYKINNVQVEINKLVESNEEIYNSQAGKPDSMIYLKNILASINSENRKMAMQVNNIQTKPFEILFGKSVFFHFVYFSLSFSY